MPQHCTICASPHREAIDAALVAGTASHRAIARQFAVERDSVRRHAQTHLRAALIQVEAVRESERGASLRERMEDLYQRTLGLLDRAVRGADLRTAATLVAQVRANVELAGRLTGELTGGATVQVQAVAVSGGVGGACPRCTELAAMSRAARRARMREFQQRGMLRLEQGTDADAADDADDDQVPAVAMLPTRSPEAVGVHGDRHQRRQPVLDYSRYSFEPPPAPVPPAPLTEAEHRAARIEAAQAEARALDLANAKLIDDYAAQHPSFTIVRRGN